MKVSKGEKITEGVTYQVEFTKAEEVAEMGEYARKEVFNLPYSFSMEDGNMMNSLFENANKIMEDKNFDTFVIQKETYEEFVFFKEVD
jgi:hypothetical protein